MLAEAWVETRADKNSLESGLIKSTRVLPEKAKCGQGSSPEAPTSMRRGRFERCHASIRQELRIAPLLKGSDRWAKGVNGSQVARFNLHHRAVQRFFSSLLIHTKAALLVLVETLHCIYISKDLHHQS